MNNKNHLIFMGLILVLMVIPMTVLLSQPSRMIGGPRDEQANAIVRSITLPNGGYVYVMAGWTKSFSPPPSYMKRALIVRTNQNGTPINNAVVSVGPQEEEATSMARTLDNGYVVAGWTRSYSQTGTTSNADIFVIKLNANLALPPLWAKVYQMPYDQKAFSIISVSPSLNGGYALTGTHKMAGNASRIIVLRLFPDGNVNWLRTYSIKLNNTSIYNYNEGLSITEVSDTSAPDVKFAVAGYAISATTRKDAFIMRLNINGTNIKSDGTSMGANIFSGGSNVANHDEQASSVVWDGLVTQPGIVAAGWTSSRGNGTLNPPYYANVWAVKIKAANGTLIWANGNGYVYQWQGGLERDDKVLGDKSLIVIPGNLGSGYAMSGLTHSRGPNAANVCPPNFLLIRLKYDGTLDWNGNVVTVHPSVIPNNRIDEAYGMVQSAAIPNLGNGFAVVGRSNSFTSPLNFNFLFTTFAWNGTRPIPPGCAVQYPMQCIPFPWTIKEVKWDSINISNIKRIDFKQYPVSSFPVCATLSPAPGK